MYYNAHIMTVSTKHYLPRIDRKIVTYSYLLVTNIAINLHLFSHSADCEACGAYVRLVYPLTLGLLPLLGLVVVVVFERSTVLCSRKQEGKDHFDSLCWLSKPYKSTVHILTPFNN